MAASNAGDEECGGLGARETAGAGQCRAGCTVPAVQWSSGAWRALARPGTTSTSTCTTREGQTLRAPALEKEKLAKCAASREVAPMHPSLRSNAMLLKS